MGYQDKLKPIPREQISAPATTTSGYASKLKPVARPQVVAQKQEEPDLMHKLGAGLSSVFGGEKIGEAIGTQIAKGNLGDTLQKFAVGRKLTPQEESLVSMGPSGKQIAGDVIRTAALPVGIALTGGTSILGQSLVGGATGYAYDVGSKLSEGKDVPEAVVPGMGTVAGLVAPGVVRGIGASSGPITSKVGTALSKTLPTKSNVVSKRVKAFNTVFQSSGSPRRFFERSGGKGYSVSETIANNDNYIPEVVGGKITPESAQNAILNIQKDAQARARIVDEIINSEPKYISLADWKNSAIKEIEHLKLSGDKYERTLEKINKDFASYEKLADVNGQVPLSLINNAKKAKYENINWKMEDDLYTADRAVARGSKKVVEDSLDDYGIKELNYEVGRLYDAQEGLETLARSGATIPGGRLGRGTARLLGAITGTGAGPVGSLVGALTADQLSTILQKTYFKNNPMLKAIIGDIAEQEPEMFMKALELAKKNRYSRLLPAPGQSSYRSSISSGQIIPVLPTGRNIDPVGFKTVGSTPSLPADISAKEALQEFLSQ